MMVSKPISKYLGYLAFFIALFAFSYTLFRAASLSLTHDEAVTFLYHSLQDYREIILFSGMHQSNNHLLNTLLIKITTTLFGESELAIRAPALLGHLLYLIFTWKALTLFMKGYKIIFGYSVLVLQPMLLDLFSIARGYSLAFGFFAYALYLFFKYIGSNIGSKNTFFLFSVTFLLGLSVLSNFVFINAYAAALVIIAATLFLEKRQIKYYLLLLPSFFVLFLLLYRPALSFQANHEITYGGRTGFFYDTVISLAEFIAYDKILSQGMLHIVSLSAIFFVLACTIHLFRHGFRQNEKYAIFILFYLSVLVFLNLFQKNFLGMSYLGGRYASFYLPVFFMLASIFWQSAGSRAVSIAFFLISALFAIHFLTAMNSSYSLIWKQDAGTKEAVAIMSDLSSGRENITLGINWLFEPGINYYIRKYFLKNFNEAGRLGPDGQHDYYYLLEEDLWVAEKHNLKIIKEFPVSRTYLAVPEKLKN